MSRKQPVTSGVAGSVGTAKRSVARLLMLVVTCVAPNAANAQRPTRLDLGGAFIEVGGEAERYLRVLQVAGIVPLSTWTIQPFSTTQLRALRPAKPHPWSARFDTLTEMGSRVLRPKARMIGNSAFPYQDGAGPTWAGRGFTGELQAGVAAWWRNVYFQAAPLAFAAQNAAFQLASNGVAGDGSFADARFPLNIDAPQRFGSTSYKRFDPGASILSADAGPFTAALTSAAQRWGPAREYPLLMGPNAGGFPALYLGTSAPVDAWLFKIHGRVEYGHLDQSAYTPAVDGERHRLGTGMVGTIEPRGVPGLEIGGGRFSHEPWTGISGDVFGRPFNSLNLFGVATNQVLENQVATVFFRWALPTARAEFYGEMYREDYPGHFHEALSLVEKPDDLMAYTIGFQRVLMANGERVRVVRGEVVNGETSHQERDTRGFVVPLPPYVHSGVTQGHTLNGLLLGSPEAYGGAGWRLGYDEFTSAGRWSVAAERSLRMDWLPVMATTSGRVRPDVVYALRGEVMRFHGRADVGAVLIPSVNFNRDLVASHDVWNVALAVTVRGWP